MLIAVDQGVSEHIPWFHSMLMQGELDTCKAVHDACVQLQDTLNTHRAARLANISGNMEALRLIELYNTTLSHLDAACDGLYEISHQ